MKKHVFTLLLTLLSFSILAQNDSTSVKKLSFKFSGFLNLNTILDFNGLDNYDDFTTSQIPINPNPYENTYRFHMTARQSRLNGEINYLSPWGKIRGFVSSDFYSGNTGEFSYFRLREAYLEIGNFLFGQSNTSFSNSDIVPATIDFEGPNSAPTLRIPMIKYSNKIKKGWSYSLAVEMRGTDITTFPKTGNAFTALPCLVGNVNKEGKWGVVTLSGMFDITRYFNADSIEHHEYAYGGALSTIINTWDKNHFSVFFVAGKGISNFISDLSGNGYNGVPDLATNEMTMLNSIGGFIAYTQYWHDKFSSNFLFSYIELEKSPLLTKDDFRYSNYALVNLFYAPFDRLSIGAEYIWGELFVQNNNNGTANRLQFLIQFNF
jgi:hypothetical protein